MVKNPDFTCAGLLEIGQSLFMNSCINSDNNSKPREIIKSVFSSPVLRSMIEENFASFYDSLRNSLKRNPECGALFEVRVYGTEPTSAELFGAPLELGIAPNAAGAAAFYLRTPYLLPRPKNIDVRRLNATHFIWVTMDKERLKFDRISDCFYASTWLEAENIDRGYLVNQNHDALLRRSRNYLREAPAEFYHSISFGHAAAAGSDFRAREKMLPNGDRGNIDCLGVYAESATARMLRDLRMKIERARRCINLHFAFHMIDVALNISEGRLGLRDLKFDDSKRPSSKDLCQLANEAQDNLEKDYERLRKAEESILVNLLREQRANKADHRVDSLSGA